MGRGAEPRQKPPPAGFNPSVGILWGGTNVRHLGQSSHVVFQSLGRDSVGWDAVVESHSASSGPFQSLGRDSVGWDHFLSRPPLGPRRRFQSLGRDSVGWDAGKETAMEEIKAVSIPRSGFCGVGPGRYPQSNGGAGGGFNPSVGILWGGTGHRCLIPVSLAGWFQSLGRDSVGWDRC